MTADRGRSGAPGGSAVSELVTAHLGLAHRIADRYYLPGSDEDDVRQEAAIGLIEAARSYQAAGGPFPPFAATVIRRRLFDRMQAEQYDKRRAHHGAVRDMVVDNDGDPLWLFDLLEAVDSDPADQAILRESLRNITAAMGTLSPLERRSLIAAVNGEPYAVAGAKDKRADNAIVRARAKLREAA